MKGGEIMKLGIKTFLMVTLIAIIGIVLAKVVVNKVEIPGVSKLVNAV
jgi:hypothetical protein